MRKEQRADDAALDEPVITPRTHEDELVVLRVDYFENYAGRFLSVEAKTRLATMNDPPDPSAAPTVYTGPTLSLSWNSGAGTPIDSTPRVMNLNIDPDTTPDTYIEHRELVRIGDAGTFDAAPARPDPDRLEHRRDDRGRREHVARRRAAADGRRASSADFTTRYMDPTEVYERFDELAAEFPNIAQLIPLPNRTNGYQRRAQATMERHDGDSGERDPEHRPAGAGRASSRGPSCSRRARGATRAATTSPPSSSIRAQLNAPLTVHGDRQRPARPARDRRHRRADEHGGAGRRGDQREPGREREARRR